MLMLSREQKGCTGKVQKNQAVAQASLPAFSLMKEIMTPLWKMKLHNPRYIKPSLNSKLPSCALDHINLTTYANDKLAKQRKQCYLTVTMPTSVTQRRDCITLSRRLEITGVQILHFRNVLSYYFLKVSFIVLYSLDT